MKFKSKIYRQFVFTHEFFRYLMVDRVMIEKDNIVLITGKRGGGKTTLTIKQILGFADLDKIQMYYNKERNVMREKKIKYTLPKFTPFVMEEHMAFQRKSLHNLCRDVKRGFILADEAVVNAARRNSMSKANKILHEIITINRKNFNTVFFCLPSVEDFDISILQYVTCWIHIDNRGLACVLMPNRSSIFGRKTWDIDRMKKIYEKYLEENPRAIDVPYWLFDNFRGYIKFGKLPKAIEQNYLKIAHEMKNKDTEEEDGGKTKKPRLDEATTTLLSEIADKIISGELQKPEEYYKNCLPLGFNKSRLNREVNELLATRGDGRSATKAIRDNKTKADSKKEVLKSTRYRI